MHHQLINLQISTRNSTSINANNHPKLLSNIKTQQLKRITTVILGVVCCWDVCHFYDTPTGTKSLLL